MSEPLAVACSVVDVWAHPREGPDEERVTQALLGCPVEVEARRGGWALVRLPDYRGWVRGAALAPSPSPRTQVFVVARPRVQLEGDVAGTPRHAYLGTVLPAASADGAHVAVLLPGGGVATIARAAGWLAPCERPFPPRPPQESVRWAHSLVGAPYLWGGVTADGIDCSALVQLAFRLCGVRLPRDADQQWAALPTSVPRGEIAAGDLLFFAREGGVVHVALALDATHFIHALGDPPRGVCIESLDPRAADYNARLDALYVGARRIRAGVRTG